MSKSSIRSGTKTPFKPNVDMGSVKLNRNRNDIYKKVVEYERNLRIIALRFKYDSIDELPKQIYSSRVINALNKVRANSSASTMGLGDGAGAIGGIAGDLGIPTIVPVATTQNDPWNGAGQPTVAGYGNEVDVNNIDVQVILHVPVAANEQRGDELKILATPIAIDPSSEAPPSSPQEETKISNDFIDKVFKAVRIDPTQSERNELRRLLESRKYDNEDDLRSVADQIAGSIVATRPIKTTTTEEKNVNINETITDGYLADIFDEIKATYTTPDIRLLQNYLVNNQPYANQDILKEKALEEARNIIKSKSSQKSKYTQVHEGIHNYEINDDGEVLGYDKFDTLVYLNQVGKWFSGTSYSITDYGARYTLLRDANGYFSLPSGMPTGMPSYEWRDLTNKMKEENKKKEEEKDEDGKPKRPPPVVPIDRNKPEKKDEPDKPYAPPDAPDNPRRDRRKTIQIPQSSLAPLPANRTLGIASLRPFFSTYHGLDLLIETDKEAIEDIKQYDLFDLPIPENDNMDNPLFVHNMKTQMARFTDDAKPFQYATVKNTITSEILATNFDGSLTQEMILSNVPFIDNGVATQNCIDIENLNIVPTILGGLKDGVPFRNPNTNNYQRGFGQADRTAAGYTESIIQSLYANPEIYNSLITIRNPFK